MLTLEGARQKLDPYQKPVFTDPVLNAVATWQKFVCESPALAKPMDETARANMIHCWWREGVRQSLVSLPGIREITSLGFFAVAVGPNPIVRFKLLGDGGRPSNVETDRQILLSRQEYDDDSLAALASEGIPTPPTILTCGYALDEIAEIRFVEVRCDYKQYVLWRWIIWGDAGGGYGEIEQLPLPNMPSPQPARVKSVRQRDAKGRRETK